MTKKKLNLNTVPNPLKGGGWNRTRNGIDEWGEFLPANYIPEEVLGDAIKRAGEWDFRPRYMTLIAPLFGQGEGITEPALAYLVNSIGDRILVYISNKSPIHALIWIMDIKQHKK